MGYVSAVDIEGRTIWIVDAHRDDRKMFTKRHNTTAAARTLGELTGAEPEFLAGRYCCVRICSNEHGQTTTATAAPGSAYPRATTRIELMAETSEALRQIFEKIRDEAERALKLIDHSRERRSLAWTMQRTFIRLI